MRHPGSEILVWPLWTNFNLDRVSVAGPCFDCGYLTQWVDYDFMIWMHPGLCSLRKWREYELALASQPSPTYIEDAGPV